MELQQQHSFGFLLVLFGVGWNKLDAHASQIWDLVGKFLHEVHPDFIYDV